MEEVKNGFWFCVTLLNTFGKVELSKNVQKKRWLCVPAVHASNPIYYIKKGKGSFWHSDLNEWVKPKGAEILL